MKTLALTWTALLFFSNSLQEEPQKPKIDLPKEVLASFENMRDLLEDGSTVKDATMSMRTRIGACDRQSILLRTNVETKDPKGLQANIVFEISVPWQKIKSTEVVAAQTDEQFEARLLLSDPIVARTSAEIALAPGAEKHHKDGESKLKVVAIRFAKRAEARKFTEAFDSFRAKLSPPGTTSVPK